MEGIGYSSWWHSDQVVLRPNACVHCEAKYVTESDRV